MPGLRTATWIASLSLACAALTACGGSEPDSDGTGSGPGSGTTGDPGTTSGTPGGTGGDGGSGATGGNGSGASGATGGSATGGGPPSFEGYTRVDTGNGTALTGGADVAIAPDGTIYVSWTDEQNGSRDVFVAKSTDGGETFGAAVKVDDAGIVPLISMARHPYVAADDTRVAVTFNDAAGVVHLYMSSASGPLTFGQPTILGTDVVTMFRDFPKPMFLADGTILVAWQGYPDTGARIFVSRETQGFASEEASGGAPGLPCECCPLDLLRTSDGDAMAAFRNNDGNVREMWLAQAPGGGAFSDWAAVSTSEGTIGQCPMQGPRLAEAGSGHLSVWSVRGSQNTGSVFISSSDDGGGSWSGGESVGGFVGDEPTIAIGASGRIFVTGVTGNKKSSIVWSDDGGGSWTQPEAIQSPDGELAVPQAENGGGVAALVGVTTAGTVWFRRME